MGPDSNNLMRELSAVWRMACLNFIEHLLCNLFSVLVGEDEVLDVVRSESDRFRKGAQRGTELFFLGKIVLMSLVLTQITKDGLDGETIYRACVAIPRWYDCI
jgi:hypothetical protein